MERSIESLQACLLNVAREKRANFQNLLNQLGAEQFLYRLSISPYSDKFIFKGGSLLTYLINSERKTKDLDFSIREIGSKVEELTFIIKSILEVPTNDGFVWDKIEGIPLNHPDMKITGVRIHAQFLLGKMKGTIQMDMALGDIVEAVRFPLERMKYRGEPFFKEPITLFVYPIEMIFAEKLSIAIKKGSQNTRMKDYYDLFKICDQKLDRKKLKKSLKIVFNNRKMRSEHSLLFNNVEISQLESYWAHFLRRDNIADAPFLIREVIEKVNIFLDGQRE